MPDLVASLEGTIARLFGELGTRWPNPWAAYYGNSPAIDDCAMSISWALWGLQSNGAPFQTVVSGIIERSGLQFLAGNQGIRRGDAIGFRWSTDVNYDHIELALSSPDGAGNFLTIGTNAGPGDDMAVRTRNIAYVHNYARPAYPGFAGGDTTPITPERKKDTDMEFKIVQLHADTAPADNHWMGVLTTPFGVVQIDNQIDAKGFADLETIFGAGLNRATYSVKRDYLAGIPGVQKILTAMPKGGAVDPVALTKTIQDAIKASPLDVDEAAIGKIVAPLVAAALQPSFAALPDAIANEAADRLDGINDGK